jgi:hypothetical protein
MSDSNDHRFQEKTLDELLILYRDRGYYRADIVNMVVEELKKRGYPVPEEKKRMFSRMLANSSINQNVIKSLGLILLAVLITVISSWVFRSRSITRPPPPRIKNQKTQAQSKLNWNPQAYKMFEKTILTTTTSYTPQQDPLEKEIDTEAGLQVDNVRTGLFESNNIQTSIERKEYATNNLPDLHMVTSNALRALRGNKELHFFKCESTEQISISGIPANKMYCTYQDSSGPKKLKMAVALQSNIVWTLKISYRADNEVGDDLADMMLTTFEAK